MKFFNVQHILIIFSVWLVLYCVMSLSYLAIDKTKITDKPSINISDDTNIFDKIDIYAKYLADNILYDISQIDSKTVYLKNYIYSIILVLVYDLFIGLGRPSPIANIIIKINGNKQNRRTKKK